jgi:transcriptional regulator with XRE-family HTH domain
MGKRRTKMISERIKELKGDSTIKKAANFIGIDATSYYRYFTGVTEPRSSTIVKICNAYGVNYEWLLTGDGEMYDYSKIMPCPFCGSSNVRLESEAKENYVYCDNCHSSTGIAKTKKKSFLDWSRVSKAVHGGGD